MHTYWRSQTFWQVLFYPGGGDDAYLLFNCDSQLHAAEIVSFLNGGAKPEWLIDESNLPDSVR
jgi:hypothetical protein